MKWIAISLVFVSFWACQNNEQNDTTNSGLSAEEAKYATCVFEINQLQKVPNTPYKAITAHRWCESTGIATREVVLFDKGEPMDNKKECNVFATTDTTAQFNVQVGPNRIDIIFATQAPDSASIILQKETVYDSIEVVYSVATPTAS